MSNIGSMFSYLSNALNDLSNALLNLRNRMIGLRPKIDYDKFITEYGWIYDNGFDVTNYYCDKCEGRLIIISHDESCITYKCLACGKTYKAYKNRLWGRF